MVTSLIGLALIPIWRARGIALHQSAAPDADRAAADPAALHATLTGRSPPGAPRCTLATPPGLDEDTFRAEASELGLAPGARACEAARLLGQPGRPRRRRERPMVFVHVHKAAGSFMCGMASLNNERIVEPGVNCNWVLHDDFKQMGDGVRVTCEERAEQFSNVSWAHIEREFTDQDFCPQHFDYVTVLREPVVLAQSEINFRNFSVSELEASLRCIKGLEACDESHKDDNVPLWKFLDNFQVRMLGGMETWELPPGGVLSEHKDKVVNLLEKFYRVIPFGRLKSSPTLLKTSFGWSVDQLAQKDPMGDWERNPLNPAMRPCNFTFSAAQLERVQRASWLDAELHGHFQARFAE